MRNAFETGNHEEAVRLALPLAEKGDAKAIHLLGFAHETGQGTDLSAQKAEEYYRKGMAQNYSDSAYRLSFLLIASGEKENLPEARAILEKQATTDLAVAGRILGETHLRGTFTGEPDVENALTWWTKSADAGDTASMLFLARFHNGEFGPSEKIDPSLALGFFTKAAESGDPGAMVAAGSRMLYGEKSDLDEKRGLELLNKAIDAKNATAYLALGTWQETVKKDPKSALVEFQKGAEAGQPECMIRAAQYHMEGRGTEKNVSKGLELLGKAAGAGDTQAHYMLAAHRLQGETPNIVEGYRHLLSAANGGLAAAQNDLGILYLSGNLGISDPQAAASWFALAAQSNFAAAQNNLGALYEQGTAIGLDYEKAAQLYAAAAQQGHPSATLALARFHAAGAGTDVNRPMAWALAKVAEELGEKNAAKFLTSLETELTAEQLTEGKKELARITGGKSDKPLKGK